MSAADAHAHAYDEAKHPRGARGRFAGGGTATIVQPRSLTRGEAWQRTGAKLPGIPIGYTGSREKELPVGSFTHHQLKAQVPDAMSADDHRELVGSLVSVIANERSGAIEKGHERRLIPDGTERHTINRAYNHAAMHSLHSFGTHDYDFKMDDHLKAELTPLVPFMRYAHRRVKDVMLAKHKGKWRPYREAFGQPFNDLRRDKITGAIRKRVRPNQELIKRISPVTVLATGGTAALAALGVGAAIHNRLKEARDKDGRWKKSAVTSRLTGRDYVEKLAKAEARDHKGRWTSGGIAAAAAVGIGAGLALLALPRALRQRELAAYVPRANLDVRNTKVLNTASLIRGWRHLGNHAVDIVTNPTGAGKRPTGKQIRRQFARDAFMARERTITVGRDGKVRQSIRGTATAGVRIDDPKLAAYATDAEAGNVGRMYHNHPVDAAPSLQDAEVHLNLKEMARAHGRSAPVTHVYGFGRVATGAKAGKTRVRVTRFDDADDAVIDRSPFAFDIPSLPEDFFDWSPEEQSAHYDTIRDSMVKKPSRPNPKEADWKAARAAGKSNYRTRYVEKLHKRFHSATHPAAYAMLPDALKHLVPPPNPLEMAAIEHDPTMPPHVKAIMPMTRNILSSIGWANKGPQRQNARRHARSKLIADPNVPLSHALAKAWAQQARGAGGRWVAGAGAGAIVLGGALAYKDAKRLWRIHHIHSLLRRNARLGQPADTRGTTHLRLRSLLPDAHVHLGDIVHRRAARGKTPNEHVVGRQFLRDSAMVRERMILTDKAGKVLLNIPGDAAGVAFRSMSEANRFLRHMTRGEIATTYHNHPLDAVPSISDVLAHRMITEAAQAAGADEPVSYVYSHGRIGPKTRTRITRYDGKIEADGNDAEAGRNLTVADWEKAQGTGSTYHTTFVEKLAKRWAENRTG